MNDRELLELAAKAAGYKYSDLRLPGESGLVLLGQTYWDPIDDDGDALRLAVKLHLFDASGFMKFRLDETRQDPTRSDYEITRRAIVRAAAEIGRKMQEGGAA